MTVIRCPRSIRARYTAATSLLALIVLTGLGTGVCLSLRHVLAPAVAARAGQMTAPAVPLLLRGHGLECLVGALVLTMTAGVGAATWWFLGRVLRSIQAIRTHLDGVTVNDLGHRMRIPPGDDEITELARTADHTLARLDEAVARQRHFVATTSHELRNPITGLRAELEDALDHPEDTDPRHTLRAALTITDRLDTIITDLLAQARTDTTGTVPEYELIDLTELVTQEAVRTNRAHAHDGVHGGGTAGAEQAARTDQPAGGTANGSGATGTGDAPRNIPVRLRARDDVWVCGSRIQIIRALVNLLGNARRHATTAVDLTLTTSHGQAVIAVADDGPGVPPADRLRIFERFTRLDDARRLETGGSGLGLAITRDIAHQHRGSLILDDSARGARFVLRIPHLDPPAVFRREPLRVSAGASARSEEDLPGHAAEDDGPRTNGVNGRRRSALSG
ncbi:HAMP domain-containing sensor histidine kinase [Streptosporangium sp. NPDC048865]|uniref:sensor histidine kinase n=1 Tax=Streptosporangium sp. NPDC048865 TaxID=3155766 RepID=UPI0034219E48